MWVWGSESFPWGRIVASDGSSSALPSSLTPPVDVEFAASLLSSLVHEYGWVGETDRFFGMQPLHQGNLLK